MTTATPVPRVDPRIRERRIAVQRALGRRRLRILLVIAAAIVAAGVAMLVVDSPLLDVDRIQVEGAAHVSAAEIRAATHVKNGSALLFVDTAAVRRRVEQMPWVEHARVQRVYPATVRVTVTEYQPAVYVRAGTGVVLIAANGHAIAHVAHAPAGVTEIRGLRAAPADGELLSPPEAAGVVAQLPRALATQVIAVDITSTGVALDLARGGNIRLGAATDLDAKAAAALAVLARRGTTPFSYIDVSTPATPVLGA
jgi:cell division protein FtsQ